MADQEKTFGIKFNVDKGNTDAAFASLGNSIGGVEKKASSLSTGLVGLGRTLVGIFAGYQIGRFFMSSAEEAGKAEAAVAQLNAVLKSTGNAAGLTANEILKLSKELQRETAFGDEAVTSAQSLLLTFTNIKKDIFPQATRTILDMSVALGQDLSSSAVQLGKALQDPILGVTALRRVGVNFNTSQTEMIKKMVETGRAAEAQAYILKELSTEFGGSAQAELQSYTGKVKQMQNTWGDFKEVVGNALIPSFEAILTGFATITQAGTDAGESVARTFGIKLKSAFLGFGALVTSLNPFSENFGKAGFEKLIGDIVDMENEDIKKFKDAQDKLANLLTGNGVDSGITDAADTIESAFRDVSKAVVSSLADQEKAINNLRKSMIDLDKQTEDSLSKANDNYDTQVTNLARNAKKKKEELEKQIEQEKSTQGAGFRTRISELEAEKAKEQAIIDKAGGVVSDLNSELAKDEFDTLKESHDKELAEIKRAAEEKKAETQSEIDARRTNVALIQGTVGASDFYAQAGKEGSTFAGSIGAGGIQQILQFTFNGDVAGDEAIAKIKKSVIDALDRQATLRKIGAK